jgi:hypothetical protein
MSRLIEEFQRASRAAVPAMGFRTARTGAPAPKMLLITSLEARAVKGQVDSLNAAHAVLIRFDGAIPTAKSAQALVAALPDLPWGFYLEDDADKKASTLVKAGADFLAFPAAVRIADIPGDEKLGKILQVESFMDDGLLRAVNDLPVDAALVADTSEDINALVWHQLMIYQHLANFISKPIIVAAPASINETELKALWEAGVDGIVVEAAAAGAEGLKTLRRAIDGLPLRPARKRGKAEALLPRLPSETGAEPPGEDGDE